MATIKFTTNTMKIVKGCIGARIRFLIIDFQNQKDCMGALSSDDVLDRLKKIGKVYVYQDKIY